MTRERLLRAKVNGLRKTIVNNKRKGGKKRLTGKHEGHLYSANDILELRRRAEAKEVEKLRPKKRGRLRKTPIEPEVMVIRTY